MSLNFGPRNEDEKCLEKVFLWLPGLFLVLTLPLPLNTVCGEIREVRPSPCRRGRAQLLWDGVGECHPRFLVKNLLELENRSPGGVQADGPTSGSNVEMVTPEDSTRSRWDPPTIETTGGLESHSRLFVVYFQARVSFLPSFHKYLLLCVRHWAKG